MSEENGKSEAERFSLPSQFLVEEDETQHKLKTNKIYTYHRGADLLAHIDFSDITVLKKDIAELGEAGVEKMITSDAPVIAHSNIEGGLKPGDIEKVNDVVVREIKQDDIDQINQFLAALKDYMTDPSTTKPEAQEYRKGVDDV